MISAPKPPAEDKRLQALREYRILDSTPEQSYDDITAMASFICSTPIAYVALVDESRQWFKSRIGLTDPETDRDVAFCAHAILDSHLMEIPDAKKDERFADNPLVKKSPHVRFYAGVPLINPEGHALGTLCVVDRRPRRLNDKQRTALQSLSRMVLTQLELRRVSAKLVEALEEMKVLQGLLPICMYCKQIRDDQGYWSRMESYISARSNADFSHGICPDCLKKHFPELVEKASRKRS